MPLEIPEVPWRKASTTKRARKSEEKGAKLDKGRRSPMSGAGYTKGDFRTERWLVEDKVTDALSFRLDRQTMFKTITEAFQSRRMPQWRVTIGRGSMALTTRTMREDDYTALMERLEHLEELVSHLSPEVLDDPSMPGR